MHLLARLVLSAADRRCQVKKESALLTASRQKQAPAMAQTQQHIAGRRACSCAKGRQPSVRVFGINKSGCRMRHNGTT
jgi:hypothetical protein